MDAYKRLFKAFSNETRFRIICLLRKGPLTAKAICKKTGFEQSRVSHNLKCLINCGFAHFEKKGKWKIYSLDKDAILPMMEILDEHVERYKKKLESCEVISDEYKQ